MLGIQGQGLGPRVREDERNDGDTRANRNADVAKRHPGAPHFPRFRGGHAGYETTRNLVI
jgi:hypothetical protein